MKTVTLLLLCSPLLAVSGPHRYGQAGAGRGANASQACPRPAECPLITTAVTTPTTLPAHELVSALEEERVAHDLYTAAAERWNLRVFSNIASAETRHAAALAQLAAASGIALPAAQRGIYVTPEHQRLHEQLLAIVNQSETGALGAGALVEETDISDLRRMMAVATDSGTRSILSNLERASANHLRAFVRNLRVRGITYEPKLLTAAEYQALIGG